MADQGGEQGVAQGRQGGLNHCFWLLSRVHHTREGGGCPRLRRLTVPNARKRLRTLSAQDARRVGDGRGEAGMGGWRQGRAWPLTPSTAKPMESRPALSPSDGGMERGRRGIARRPVVVTRIGLSGST